MRETRIIIAAIFIGFFCVTCDHSSDAEETLSPTEVFVYIPPPETGDGWETSSLDGTGIDVSRLEDLIQDAQDGTYDALHGLLIVRGEELVFEAYLPGYASSGGRNEGVWREYDRDTEHECQSATKSFRSTALGIAIDQGYVDGVDVPVLSFFPELEDLNAGEKAQITLWHLLTMSSGLDWPETQLPFSDERNPLRQLYQLPRANWARFIFDRPMEASPGTVWNYCSGLTFLIQDILDRTTPTSAIEFVDTHLFLQMESRRQNGFPFSDGVLPRDMAKFGSVFLNDGRWKEAQIISPEWMEQATLRTFVSPWQPPFDGGYGFLWWLKSFRIGTQGVDAFFAHGHGGQSIWVFDELDLVVVFTAGYFGRSDPVMEWLEQYVLPTFI